MPDPDAATLVKREALHSYARAYQAALDAGWTTDDLMNTSAQIESGKVDPSKFSLRPIEAYYFGCYYGAGHGLHDINMKSVRYPRSGATSVVPWTRIDGALTPGAGDPQNAVAVHYKDGWTALAFGDYSIDKRPGSNAAFFFKIDHLPFAEALKRAELTWPKVFARISSAREFTLAMVNDEGTIS